MVATDPHFDVSFKDRTIHVKRVTISKDIVYLASSDGIVPICVHQAVNSKGKKCWTSIPEGREKEAEIIGRLIEDYLETEN